MSRSNASNRKIEIISVDKDVIDNARGLLFDVATEIRALAYLLETQGTKANQISEDDMDEIGHGMGIMLNRLAQEVRKTANELDEAACSK